MIGFDHAVTGGYRAAFHQRQQVALHAFTRHIGAGVFAAPGDLVQFVDKDDAVLLGCLQGLLLDLVVVDQLRRFLFDQQRHGVLDTHLAFLRLAAAQVLEHALQLVGHFFHARGGHDLDPDLRGGIEFDLPVIQFSGQQFAQHFLTCRRLAVAGQLMGGIGFVGKTATRGFWQQDIQYAVTRCIFGTRTDPGNRLLTQHVYSKIDQVADDGFDVLADVTHLGELGGLDLDKGRVGQLGQAPGDLGLADAGGADHQDVLGCDFIAQIFTDLHPAPAVTHGDGNGALGVRLADDMLVQFLDDFTRCHL